MRKLFGMALAIMVLLTALFWYPPLYQRDYHIVSSEPFFAMEEDVVEGKLDINKAAAEEIALLPGIGATKAQAIVEQRTANGRFSTAEDLLEVSGIGPGTLEKIRELIYV